MPVSATTNASAAPSTTTPAKVVQTAAPQAVSNEPVLKRLFVGGLAADLTQTDFAGRFASFGKVINTEIVTRPIQTPTDQRFGYITIDITPASLKKCISIYNGTKWRGHALRVEEAKQDYVTRLHREQAEIRMAANHQGPKVSKKKLSKRAVQVLPDLTPVSDETAPKVWGFGILLLVMCVPGQISDEKSERDRKRCGIWTDEELAYIPQPKSGKAAAELPLPTDKKPRFKPGASAQEREAAQLRFERKALLNIAKAVYEDDDDDNMQVFRPSQDRPSEDAVVSFETEDADGGDPYTAMLDLINMDDGSDDDGPDLFDHGKRASSSNLFKGTAKHSKPTDTHQSDPGLFDDIDDVSVAKTVEQHKSTSQNALSRSQALLELFDDDDDDNGIVVQTQAPSAALAATGRSVSDDQNDDVDTSAEKSKQLAILQLFTDTGTTQSKSNNIVTFDEGTADAAVQGSDAIDKTSTRDRDLAVLELFDDEDDSIDATENLEHASHQERVASLGLFDDSDGDDAGKHNSDMFVTEPEVINAGQTIEFTDKGSSVVKAAATGGFSLFDSQAGSSVNADDDDMDADADPAVTTPVAPAAQPFDLLAALKQESASSSHQDDVAMTDNNNDGVADFSAFSTSKMFFFHSQNPKLASRSIMPTDDPCLFQRTDTSEDMVKNWESIREEMTDEFKRKHKSASRRRQKMQRAK
eukprot:jgi/Hompol1/3044/HPOL_003094-RA